MNDPILDIPQELDPSFHSWKTGEPGFACHADVEGIGGFEGESLWVGVGGGKYEQKGRALASRSQLRNLCVDGRNIPQPLIDAAGEIPGLERLHLGNIGPRSLESLGRLTKLKSLYLEGIRGAQNLSIYNMTRLDSASISGDSDAVVSLLEEGNASIRCLTLGGTASANLKLPDLELLRRLPSIEYLIMLNVSVSSRSLEPCLSLPRLRQVILNFSRSWNRDSISALRERGISVRCRMDEIRLQMT